MIDWCKSNKNIALFITLPSKDSPIWRRGINQSFRQMPINIC